MEKQTFDLKGPFTPYVRMTRRGAFVKPEAVKYLASQRALAWQFKEQMLAQGWEMLPAGAPLRVRIYIEMPHRLHCQDVDNQAKALIDAAQGVVFPNDLWIDSLYVGRRIGVSHRAVFVVETLKDSEEAQDADTFGG